MDAIVRQAVPEDADAIAAVHIQSWQAAYRGLLPDQFLDNLSQELQRRSQFWRTEIATPRTDKHEVWVVQTGKQLDGFAGIGPGRDSDSDTGELYAIYVHPNRWQTGLGRALLRQATHRLEGHGYSTAFLWVLASNARARRFYEIAGWTFDGVTKLETHPEGFELHEVLYRIRFGREREGQYIRSHA